MRWLTRPERWRPRLAEGEQILAATEAIATGTGRLLGIAVTLGMVVGLLYSTTGDAIPLLPAIVLGGFVGVIAGYLAALLSARTETGPGAMIMLVVMTNQRLILLRRSASLRSRPLRSFALGEIVQVSTKRAPVGQFGRVQFQTERETIDVFVRDWHDFATLYRKHTESERVD